jgi:hypothetical protein
MIDRYPFSLDAIQAPVCPEAPVTLESAVLSEVGATSVAAYPSLIHYQYPFAR